MDRVKLENLLTGLVRSGGTTLHLIAGHPPCVRIKGGLVSADTDALSDQIIHDLARDMLFSDHRARLERGEEVEILYTTDDGVRFRTSLIPQLRGLSVVFSRVPEQVPSFEELDLPPMLGNLVGFRSGLVLLTGFFGSGKSTTQAALVDRINHERSGHIVTIEDPIEFIHQPGQSLLHQREIGTHVESLVEGVQHAAGQSVDVIAAGEIRDYEGLCAVLDAVERGCLVLATFTASGVVGAAAELLALAPTGERLRARYRLARALRAMVSQALIRKRHGQGRAPLLEILVKNEAVTKAILRGRFGSLHDIMARGRGLGMQTSDMALRGLLARHVISTEEAAYHANDREWVCSARPSVTAPGSLV